MTSTRNAITFASRWFIPRQLANPAFALALFSGEVLGQTPIYESGVVVRDRGKPTVLQEAFSVTEAGDDYRILVRNGPDAGERVTSGEIRLNGKVILAPRDFGRNAAMIERAVILQPDNELRIEVRGKPGGSVAVSITGSSSNGPPSANAGLDRVARVGDTVVLDGAGSTDPENDQLSYRWRFTGRPDGSNTTLSDATAIRPSLVVDLPGTYVLALVVNDGTSDSSPDEVVITTENTLPVARATAPASASTGDNVTLDGSGSFDADGDPLTYSWVLAPPLGSSALLDAPSGPRPSFVVDEAGVYEASLVVNDGVANSDPVTVRITGQVAGPPVLRIGSVRAPEGGTGGATDYVFVVTLSTALPDPVSVDYETADYSAKSREDYNLVSGSLTIPAGETEAEIRVSVFGDNQPEGDEQFAVVLGHASGGVELSSGNVGVGTIVDDDTPPIDTANLDNNSTYVGADGVTVRTLANTLHRPIEVTVSSVGAPAEPLAADVVALGGHYLLKAHEDTAANDSSLFVLSLPVPAGANTASLALATLTPPSRIRDWPGSDEVWVITPGAYDPAANMFRAVIPFLAGEGQTILLVEHPDFASPAAAPTAPVARLAGAAAAEPDPGDVVYEAIEFFVECEGFSQPCADSLKTLVRVSLDITRGRLRSLGYPEPWLLPHVIPNSLTSNLRPRADGWTVFVSPSGSAHCEVNNRAVAGVYYPDRYKLVLCTKSNESIDFAELRSLVHEYFHATQYGEVLVRAGGAEDWLIESTATVAENSTEPTDVATKLNRSEDYKPRQVHVGLMDTGTDDDVVEYEAQDFWVYAGRTRGNKDLGALKLLFGLGGDNDAADFTLRRVFGSSLADMYWEWARNQAYEKNERFADATGSNEVLGHPPCFIEEKTVVDSSIIVGPEFDQDIVVKPFSTKVVRFRTPFDLAWSFWSRGAYPQEDPSDIRVRFYNVEGAACGGSAAIEDGSRIITSPFPGDYYVVISNLNMSDTQRVRLEGDAW